MGVLGLIPRMRFGRLVHKDYLITVISRLKQMNSDLIPYGMSFDISVELKKDPTNILVKFLP